MDLKYFMVNFAQVQKAIGGGFTTISENSKKVEARMKSLDIKYEQLRAQIDALKQHREKQASGRPIKRQNSKQEDAQSEATLQSPIKHETFVQIAKQPSVSETQSTKQIDATAPIYRPLKQKPQKFILVSSIASIDENYTVPLTFKSESLVTESPIQQSLAFYSQQYLALIEAKIRQLESRLQSSKRSIQVNSQLTNKKLSSVYSDLSSTESLIRKHQNHVDLCNRKILELQEELLEFKLQKEAKLQKIISNTSSIAMQKTSSSNGDQTFKKMVIEKIKMLGRGMAACMKMQQYQQDREELDKKLSKMVKDINERVTTEVYENLVFYVEKINRQSAMVNKPTQSSQSGETNSSNNQPILMLMSNLNRQIEQLKDRLQDHSKKLVELAKTQRQNIKKGDETSELATNHTDHFTELEQSLKDCLANLDRIYEMKVGELETQAIELKQKQQKEEKLSNFRADNNFNSDVQISSVHTSKDDLKKTKVMKAEIQNEITAQTKKLNKLYLQSNQIRAELQRIRDQLRSEVDEIKAEVEKKADHETVKKSFLFVENKLNQIVTVMVHNGQTETDGDSLIAKKHWSCLSCDKNLDKFEGKLSDVRFTSTFPARFESHVLVVISLINIGYYRQNQSQKDYKKLFIGIVDKDKDKRAIGGELPPFKTDRY